MFVLLDLYQNNSHNNLHTAIFYSSSFDGTITVEATLENGITDITSWITLKTITITTDDTIKFDNFNVIVH